MYFFFLQNTKISVLNPQIIDFKNLDDSVVVLQALTSLFSLIDLSGLCSLTGLNSLYSPISSKNFLVLMVWSSLVPKLPKLVIFCRMDHQKSNFLLIYGTSFYRRLLRPAYVIFLKAGFKYQNVITSGIYRTHYIHEIINLD